MNKLDRIHRDFGLTFILSPLRFFVPILGYLALYPLLLNRSGLEVLGLWSLFSAIPAIISVVDVGYSQLLTREISNHDDEMPIEASLDYITANRAYVLVGLLCLIVSFLSLGPIFDNFVEVYSVDLLVISAMVIILGVFIQLSGKLDAGVLSAKEDNYIIQIVGTISPLVTFTCSIAGVLLGFPIEGLSVGACLSSLLVLISYRWRLVNNHPSWSKINTRLSWSDTPLRLVNLTKRGFYLYSSGLGNVVREPILRLVIAGSAGLDSAGVFEVALRVTRMARDIVATGFSSLYPAFSSLYKSKQLNEIVQLSQLSLVLLMSLGIGALGMLVGLADWVFEYWLGDVPLNLINAVRILSLWNAITILNVPFWYLLLASRQERAASLSIWAHTIMILLLVPIIGTFMNANLLLILTYWLLTSFLTQAFIFYYVEVKLKLFRRIVINNRVLLLLGMATLYFVANFVFSLEGFLSDFNRIFLTVLNISIFMLFSLCVIYQPLRIFYKNGYSAADYNE